MTQLLHNVDNIFIIHASECPKANKNVNQLFPCTHYNSGKHYFDHLIISLGQPLLYLDVLINIILMQISSSR